VVKARHKDDAGQPYTSAEPLIGAGRDGRPYRLIGSGPLVRVHRVLPGAHKTEGCGRQIDRMTPWQGKWSGEMACKRCWPERFVNKMSTTHRQS
jgi:hypothetical protein